MKKKKSIKKKFNYKKVQLVWTKIDKLIYNKLCSKLLVCRLYNFIINSPFIKYCAKRHPFFYKLFFITEGSMLLFLFIIAYLTFMFLFDRYSHVQEIIFMIILSYFFFIEFLRILFYYSIKLCINVLKSIYVQKKILLIMLFFKSILGLFKKFINFFKVKPKPPKPPAPKKPFVQTNFEKGKDYKNGY